jgi:hypothetical protein
MFARFWLVCIFSNFKCPSSKADHMKWYLNYICLVFEWKVEFFARLIALSLLQYNLLFSCFFPNSSIKLCNQIMSLLASVATTYSASIVESETTFCSFKIQLTAVPPIVKTYPVVLLLLSLSLAISESTYPCHIMLNHFPTSFEEFHCEAIRAWGLSIGHLLNHLVNLFLRDGFD